jgi:large subunit ribosomal protein L15
MKLNELKPAEGSTHGDKRVGRGHGSGWGKTATRGYNGQGQRSGSSTKVGFEGGQMPLYRRMPKKKHFTRPYREDFSIINLADLASMPANTHVTYDMLLEGGMIRKRQDGLRVLGMGELTVALTIEADHVTASAKAKIEAAGGKVIVPAVEEVQA